MKHPSEWEMSGYNEIQRPHERYALIDQKSLLEFCEIQDKEQLKKEHRQWIEEALREEESRLRTGWEVWAIAVELKKQTIRVTLPILPLKRSF